MDVKSFLIYIKNLPDKSVIYGSSNVLDNLNKKFCIFRSDKPLSSLELINSHNIQYTLEKHTELKQYLDYLKNDRNSHLIIYGKEEVENCIKEYKVKILFCHSEKISEIKNLEDKYFNFIFVEIEPLNEKDVSHELLNNYGGYIAITYF